MSKTVTCKVLREMYVGGEKKEVGSKIELHESRAKPLAFSGKVEIVAEKKSKAEATAATSATTKTVNAQTPVSIPEGDEPTEESVKAKAFKEEGLVDLSGLNKKELMILANIEGVKYQPNIGEAKLEAKLEDHFNSKAE